MQQESSANGVETFGVSPGSSIAHVDRPASIRVPQFISRDREPPLPFSLDC